MTSPSPLHRLNRDIYVSAFELCDLDSIERERLACIANHLLRDEPALSALPVFDSTVNQGWANGPAIVLSNTNDIPLLEHNSVSALEYRMSLLAQDGDIMLMRGDRCSAFEHYREHTLGLGKLNVIQLENIPPGESLASCTLQTDVERITRFIKTHMDTCSELTLIPYIGSDGIWQLAALIAEQTGITINVAAPPPRLTHRINSKLWFADRVSNVLGERALPPTRPAYGPDALSGLVKSFANQFAQVVIKVPDSAGSSGNIKLDSESIRTKSHSTLKSQLLSMLHKLGWKDQFPVMVEVWDALLVSSPSVQIWVPASSSGLPVIEGLFDQVLSGDAGEFAGATQAQIPARWKKRLISEAMQLSYLLQCLGYFGRLSFDTVITGENHDQAELHWIECNGRWGGVSIPLTAINRLLGNPSNHHYVIVQNEHGHTQPLPFADTLSALNDLLLINGKNNSGVILPVPGAADEHSATHYIAVAKTALEARTLSEEVMSRMSELP